MSVFPIYLKKWLLIFPFAGIIFFSFSVSKVQAMEPVTMAVLAPILAPYAMKAASCMFQGCVKTVPGWTNAGAQLLNIFRLPLGVIQSTLGAPFGFLGDGIGNTWQGAKAPFIMVKEILYMPVYFFGGMTDFIQSESGEKCIQGITKALKL